MKTYTEYENLEAYIADINADLSAIESVEVVHRAFGVGRLIKAFVKAQDETIFIEVAFPVGTKTLSYNVTRTSGMLSLPEGLATKLDDIKLALTEVYELRMAERREETLRKREAEKQAKLEERKRQLEEQHKLALMDKIKRMQPDNLGNVFGDLATYYQTLGWIAKHLKTIKPTVPEEMKDWFTKNFGTVENCTIVEEGKLTSGGHKMKWNVSFRVSFDAEVPAALSDKASGTAKKAVDSVSFVWALIDKHSFKFGSEQDLEAIKSTVPADCLEFFNFGYMA